MDQYVPASESTVYTNDSVSIGDDPTAPSTLSSCDSIRRSKRPTTAADSALRS